MLHNSLDRIDPYTHSKRQFCSKRFVASFQLARQCLRVAASVAHPACVLRIIRVCLCRCLLFDLANFNSRLRERRHGRKNHSKA